MNLQQGLSQLATDLNLNIDLWHVAVEDRIGGFHNDTEERRWPLGSVYEVEGQVLYALVRALKPEHIIEIGTWRGCSATHILAAMDMNHKGKLTSVDPDPTSGSDIPADLRERWEFVNGYGQIYMQYERPRAEIIFEDGPHDTEETAHILEVARDVVQPRIILSHDGMHAVVGPKIQAAYQRVFGGTHRTLLIDPSEAGFVYQVLP